MKTIKGTTISTIVILLATAVSYGLLATGCDIMWDGEDEYSGSVAITSHRDYDDVQIPVTFSGTVGGDVNYLEYTIDGGGMRELSFSGGAWSFTIEPMDDYSGPGHHILSVVATRDGEILATDIVRINVLDTYGNSPPEVVDYQSFRIPKDTPIEITIEATDPDGDPLTWTLLDLSEVDPTFRLRGTVTGSVPGVITYTPPAGYTGNDYIRYEITDGHFWVRMLIDIFVTANHPPTAAPVSATTDPDAPVTIELDGNDPDTGDTLSYGIVTEPLNGTLSYESEGSYTYTPDAGYAGPDSFTYEVWDYNDAWTTSESYTSDPATVSITVLDTMRNYAPVPEALSVTTVVDTPVAVTLRASDPNDDPVTFTVNANPGHGTLSGTPPDLTYTPGAGYAGPDSFSYTASDTELTSEPAEVSITVVEEGGYAVALSAAEEDYVDFGPRPGFMNGSDWCIIEKVKAPADASVEGWHVFRGDAWNDDPGDVAIGLRPSTGTVVAWLIPSGIVEISHSAGTNGISIERDVWYTICLQYHHATGNLKLYVNGQLSDSKTADACDDSANNNNLFFGGQDVDPSLGQGDLYTEEDAVIAHQAWYRRTLSAGEIAAYDGTVDLTDPDLFFATLIGSDAVYDAIGGDAGTLGNGPAFIVP